jgi:ABC-type transport system involved in multi-copper enzyme maturation permease subunit
MTSVASTAAASTAAATGSAHLLGFGNVLRKDVREWIRGRRFWAVAIISTLIYTLTSANAWLNDWLRANLPAAGPGEVPPDVLPMDPMSNVLAPIATQFFILAAIFATISLVIAERESGTLAWTISKPVSRTSVLVSKWASATALVWLTAVVIPLAATVAVVVALYGQPELGIVAVIGLGLVTVVALYVAVSVAAAMFVPSQAGVAAIGLAVFLLPVIVAGIYPPLGAFLPTSIGTWVFEVAGGNPVSPITPVAWAATLLALFAVARARFAAMDL